MVRLRQLHVRDVGLKSYWRTLIGRRNLRQHVLKYVRARISDEPLKARKISEFNPESKQPMKTKITKSNIVLIFAAAAAALFVAGCAEMGSANTTSLLSAAGFRARTPQTPQQQQIYAALPPYQVERATVKGKGVFYVYKDEKAGLAYVGREQEYQHYQQLAIQQQIAQERYMAAQMQADAAWQWYGAWGPRGLWW
jgi:hypothetical protein